jgi:RNA polymerase subunit RPABC4/transcription elongation factor Spt4
MEHRSQLDNGPFARNDRLRSDLISRLEGVGKLIRSANHTEARSSLNAYELAVKWSQPLVNRMSRVEERSQRGGPDSPGNLNTSLKEIENMIILEDYLGADDALKNLEAEIGYLSADVEDAGSPPPLPTNREGVNGDTVCGLCGAGIATGAIMCPVCGYDLESALAECASCGKKVSEAFNNCPFCGAASSKESRK